MQSELAEGTLITPEIVGLKSQTKRFYLMHSPANRELPALVALREWIWESIEKKNDQA